MLYPSKKKVASSPAKVEESSAMKTVAGDINNEEDELARATKQLNLNATCVEETTV